MLSGVLILSVPPPPPPPAPSLCHQLVFSPADQDKIPVWKKLTYAVGAMPYAMCNTVVGFYLNIFLLEVAIVS